MHIKQIGKGKVRDIYDIGDGKLVIVTSDRMSAFDVVLQDEIPHKGEVLNAISAFWFDETVCYVPNHMISINNADMPEFFRAPEFEGRCMLVHKLKMLPVECIVRGYITGSGWESYKKSGSICGIQLPAGLRESEKLPFPIFTPTTKAAEGHDMPLTFSQIVDILGIDLAEEVRRTSLNIYGSCVAHALSKGIIIADTKFEFGLDASGRLVLADEVLTPDSSRFWPADDYEVGRSQKSFDKQYLRDWLKSSGWNKQPPAPELPAEVIAVTSKKYIEAFEILVGTKF